MTTSGIGGFIGACAATTFVAGLLVGYAVFGRRQPQPSAVDDSDDFLVHPETTKEVKWLKMTKPTQQSLLEIYAEHMDECSKFQQGNDRVTIGEAAILWLMRRCATGSGERDA